MPCITILNQIANTMGIRYVVMNFDDHHSRPGCRPTRISLRVSVALGYAGKHSRGFASRPTRREFLVQCINLLSTDYADYFCA